MNNIFKYLKDKWYWFILLFLISYFNVFFCLSFLDNLGFYLLGKTFSSFSLVPYPEYSALCSYFSFLIMRLFSEIELYIYSYHIYTGKYNWYKFFRERSKIHKKEDRSDYLDYLKSLKNKKED